MARTVQQFVDLKIDDPVTGTVEGDNELVARYIAPKPHESGRASAYFPNHGFYVATIVGKLLHANGDIQETARAYQLPVDGVLAALAFYRQNRAIIDARLLLDLDQWDPDFGNRG